MIQVDDNYKRLRLVFASAVVAVGILAIVFAMKYVRHEKEVADRKQYLGMVLATVNEDTIRQSDVTAFSAQPAGDVLGILVDFKLLDQEAARQHIAITPEEIDRRRKNLIASKHAATYAAAATSEKRTLSGLDLQLTHSAILEALAANEVKPVPNSMVHACGVFIKTGGPHAANADAARQLAQSIQSQLNASAPVAALADKYSDDDVSRKNHGDLGIVEDAIPLPMGFGQDAKLFRALVAASPSGQVVGPVAGDHGYWAVKILSTRDTAKADKPMYAPVEGMWRSYWVQRLEPGVISRLRSHAKITPPLV